MKLKRDQRCRSICNISHVWRKKSNKISHCRRNERHTQKWASWEVPRRRNERRSDKLFKLLHGPVLTGFFFFFFPDPVIAPVGERERQKKKEEEVKNRWTADREQSLPASCNITSIQQLGSCQKKKKAGDLLPWRRQSYQLPGSKCQLTAVYWGRASGVRSGAASQRRYWGGSGRPCSENPTFLNSKYWEKKKIYLYKNLFWSFHFQSFFTLVKVIFHWEPRQHYRCTLLSTVKTI